MESNNIPNFDEQFKLIESEINDLSNETNVKKILDKNNNIGNEIKNLELSLNNVESELNNIIFDCVVDDNNFDDFMDKLYELKEKYDASNNLNDKLLYYKEAQKIICGLKQYYSQMKSEIIQIK